MTWHEAMNRFGVDKPDLRFGLELDRAHRRVRRHRVQGVRIGCVDQGHQRARHGGGVRAQPARQAHRPGEEPRRQGPRVAQGASRRLVRLTGRQVPVRRRGRRRSTSGSRSSEGDLVLIVADEWDVTCEVLGQLRNDLGRPPVHEGPYRYVWIVDFPMFVGRDAVTGPRSRATTPSRSRTPTTSTCSRRDPMNVRSQAYDLVLNGWELGSGSIRIHQSDLQRRIFAALGITEEEADRKFGFFLNPFEYGAPPHGGFAVRHRPPGRDPGRRGEHPRGHRVPEDAVRRRPDDELAAAGGEGAARPARHPRAATRRQGLTAPSGSGPTRCRPRTASGPVINSSVGVGVDDLGAAHRERDSWSPRRRPRTVISWSGGSDGWTRTRPLGTSGSSPRRLRSTVSGVPAAHAWGRQAAGYGTADRRRHGHATNNSGSSPRGRPERGQPASQRITADDVAIAGGPVEGESRCRAATPSRGGSRTGCRRGSRSQRASPQPENRSGATSCPATAAPTSGSRIPLQSTWPALDARTRAAACPDRARGPRTERRRMETRRRSAKPGEPGIGGGRYAAPSPIRGAARSRPSFAAPGTSTPGPRRAATGRR